MQDVVLVPGVEIRSGGASEPPPGRVVSSSFESICEKRRMVNKPGTGATGAGGIGGDGSTNGADGGSTGNCMVMH
eukprot:1640471-Prymnesium_polylepis.1